MGTNEFLKTLYTGIFKRKESNIIEKFKLFMIEKQFKVQSIIISRDFIDNARDARKEALEFVSEDEAKLMKPVDETDQSFRFRIRPPGSFERLRTFSPKDGVSIVGGPIKKEGVNKESRLNTEAGSHSHRLERENLKTKKDGAHPHLFILLDGAIVITENDGWHEHPLESDDANITIPKTGKHKHRIVINGQEFITEEDQGHDHQALVGWTVPDGIHFHELKLESGTIKSMLAGEFWVHIGRPPQATNALDPFMPVGMEKEDISDDRIMALKIMGYDTDLIENDSQECMVSIFKVDNPRQIVYGVVLEADTIDTQGDKISEEELEETAHNFLDKSRVIGFRHFKKADAKLIESMVVHKGDRFYGEDFIKTSWVIGAHVKDGTIWKGIEDGKINAFSVGGFAKRT